MRRNRWIAGVAVLAFAASPVWMNALGRADDKVAPEKAPAEKAASDASKSAHEDVPLIADTLTVPNCTAEELVEFIKKVRAIKPPKTQAEFKPFVTKTRGAMLEAADKILADKPEGKTRLAAIRAKVEALALLGAVAGDAKADQQLHELIGELQSDKEPEIAKLVARYQMQFEVRDLSKGKLKPEDARKLWGEIKASLTANPADKQNIQLALTAVQALSFSADTTLALQAFTDLRDIFSKSEDPKIAKAAERFDGIIRRLSLPGHPIELKGTLVDGKPFDPDSLKGKVVLVDFWATWCGPCRAELPNVKKNYAKYHDKGFEVVGISLDGDKPEDRGKLEKFLADEKISWPIIFGAAGEPHGWQESIAVYYGINAIPTTILVNQKGEVVSLNARGPKLGELLEKYIGK